MKKKRIVITGMGTINPLGNSIEEYILNLRNGVSSASTITSFDVSKQKTQFACEIPNYNPKDFFKDSKELKKLDPYSQYALIATEEAIKSASIDLDAIDKDRVGVILGVGIGGGKTFFEQANSYNPENPKFSPFFIPKMIADIAGALIAMKYGFEGPNYTATAACASASYGIEAGVEKIQLGKADMFIVGGAEAAVNEIGICGFGSMHAISKRNDDPKTASRPFDKDRDGFVIGEGAGILVIEEYEHAKNRGVEPIAEIVGTGTNCDAHDLTAPHPEGRGAAKVMNLTIKDANLQLKDIDYVNVHGTSTDLGDIAEPKAILDVFGDHAYKLNISATKSMTGHLLGAAGAVEAIAVIDTLQSGIIHPTINQFNLDSNIDSKLNFTFNEAQQRNIRYALSNTFGFGGHNACICFKKWEG